MVCAGMRIGEVERTGESGQQGWQNRMKQWLLLHGSQNCCCPLYLSLCPSSGGRGSLALQGLELSLGCYPAPKCLLSSAICLLYPCLELTLLQEVAVQINLGAARGLVIIKD